MLYMQFSFFIIKCLVATLVTLWYFPKGQYWRCDCVPMVAWGGANSTEDGIFPPKTC